jgi:hypothetical protein
MRAKIGEVQEMCAPLEEAPTQPDAAASLAISETWWRMADKPCLLTHEDEAQGRTISAVEMYSRAATCLPAAERLQAHGAPGRLDMYRRFLSLFAQGVDLTGENCERVEIPWGRTRLAALYVRADHAGVPSESGCDRRILQSGG